MAEDETTLTAQTEPNSVTDTEFSGFKPENIIRGTISEPN